MSFKIDEKSFEAELKKQENRLRQLSGRQVFVAHASALNKAASMVKSKTLRVTAKKLKIKQANLRYKSVSAEQARKKSGAKKSSSNERIQIRRAKPSKAEVSLNVNGSKIQLSNLKPRQLKSGVKADGSFYKNSFLATPTMNPKGSIKGRGDLPAGLAGKEQVFFRKDKNKRYGIKARYKWVRDHLKAVMNKEAEEMMAQKTPGLLKREYDYRINRELSKVR